MEIIVTDLTRFNNQELLCMAGLTADGQTCIRPMRRERPSYLRYSECKEKSLIPGMVLEGNFEPVPGAEAPHVEDHHFDGLKIVRSCTSEEFEQVLQNSAVNTFQQGFGARLTDKVFRVAPPRSIITLEIDPQQISIVPGYEGKGIKANITDAAYQELRFLPITDLGFYDYVGNLATRRMTIRQINSFIEGQDRVFVRVGLSRHFATENRSGYWMQVNGIYTFPDHQRILRQY